VIPFKQSNWQNRFNYSRSVICRYRVEQAINLSFSFDVKNDIVIHKKMISAIRIHRKAMESVSILRYVYNTGEFFLIALKFETLSRRYE